MLHEQYRVLAKMFSPAGEVKPTEENAECGMRNAECGMRNASNCIQGFHESNDFR